MALPNYIVMDLGFPTETSKYPNFKKRVQSDIPHFSPSLSQHDDLFRKEIQEQHIITIVFRSTWNYIGVIFLDMGLICDDLGKTSV